MRPLFIHCLKHSISLTEKQDPYRINLTTHPGVPKSALLNCFLEREERPGPLDRAALGKER